MLNKARRFSSDTGTVMIGNEYVSTLSRGYDIINLDYMFDASWTAAGGIY